ncbi:MAG: CRISPR-associated endonuclease Cas1 [Nitrospira sp.]|nr:CRISPR-associated endonuclease Cas1 [Nitrospira sp.]MCP9442059.1 CRISPR-associated endonuclease Cas1 [Nitrospira sp.]
MERTLFLNERAGLRVRRDGPSLWIEQPGSAGSRVPVRLIRRVLIAGNVALDAESLTAFAERGVPVTLVGRNGQAVAMVVSCASGLCVRRGLQIGAMDHPSGRERISAWLRAWERGRRLALAARLDSATAARWRCLGVRTVDYEQWVQRLGHQLGATPRQRRLLHAAVSTLILDRITERGWDPHIGAVHHGEPLGFVKDCAMAIRADTDRLWLEQRRLAPHSEVALSRDVAECFERHRPRLARLLDRLLDQYGSLLQEL